MRNLKRLVQSLCVLGIMGVASTPSYGVLITFNELSSRPLNGVSLQGVTFGFTIDGVASTDAQFNTIAGPGGIAPFITPPNAEGNSLGILSFTFDQPSTQIQFGLARSVQVGTSGASVELFSGATSLGVTNLILNIPPGAGFPEATFTSSATGVTSGRITFTLPATAPRFALDNFGFIASGTPTAVPEPATFTMAGMGALMTLGYAWRRRRTAVA